MIRGSDALRPVDARTPADAFDALYESCASGVVRQVYLLGGRRALAHEAAIRAFQLAWHRWPEVAVDPDPSGWIRAAAWDHALSPWRRLRPRHRRKEVPGPPASDRAVLDVLRSLPPYRRRVLLLHDGLGLDLPDTAAEVQASTPATADRLMLARTAVSAALPRLADPQRLHDRLTDVAAVLRVRLPGPADVRAAAERRARRWTWAAVAFLVALPTAAVLPIW